MHERIKAEYSAKILLSKNLMELKDKVRKLTFAKKYEEGEML